MDDIPAGVGSTFFEDDGKFFFTWRAGWFEDEEALGAGSPTRGDDWSAGMCDHRAREEHSDWVNRCCGFARVDVFEVPWSG